MLVPVLICLFKWRIMERAYRPFAIYMVVSFIAELSGTISIQLWRSNVVSTNLFAITQVLLLTWLFYDWGLFHSRRVFHLLLVAELLIWVMEKIFLFPFMSFDSYAGVGFSMAIVLMSVSMINRILVSERSLLLQHPKFLACTAFIIYFTYDILVEIFWIYGLNSSDAFRMRVYHILVYVNLLSNLLYILVSLWIPRKRAYSLL